MKKSSLTASILGTVSVVLFALGMCMALLPEWNAFQQGILVGCTGLVLGAVTAMVWRKMEGKQPVRLHCKAILTAAVGVAGALALGAGMCFCMVWNQMVPGIMIGLAGILVLLCLIPLTKGIR